ncbi:hypothetical protein ANO11243_083310 [Dothideomycetidae sp. 11243]|nr:hypothetical protein ANO11243_083310 [fungal sp. No.11243]
MSVNTCAAFKQYGRSTKWSLCSSIHHTRWQGTAMSLEQRSAFHEKKKRGGLEALMQSRFPTRAPCRVGRGRRKSSLAAGSQVEAIGPRQQERRNANCCDRMIVQTCGVYCRLSIEHAVCKVHADHCPVCAAFARARSATATLDSVTVNRRCEKLFTNSVVGGEHESSSGVSRHVRPQAQPQAILNRLARETRQSVRQKKCDGSRGVDSEGLATGWHARAGERQSKIIEQAVQRTIRCNERVFAGVQRGQRRTVWREGSRALVP